MSISKWNSAIHQVESPLKVKYTGIGQISVTVVIYVNNGKGVPTSSTFHITNAQPTDLRKLIPHYSLVRSKVLRELVSNKTLLIVE